MLNQLKCVVRACAESIKLQLATFLRLRFSFALLPLRPKTHKNCS